MDMLGNEYSYRVSEAALTYADGTKVNVTGTFDADTDSIWTSDSVGAYTGKVTITKDEAGAFKASAENTLIVDELTVTKVWNDGQNRDGVRPESISVKLYKNDTVIDERTFTAQDLVEGTTDQWSYTWKNLPVYGTDGSRNVYSVVEKALSSNYEAATYAPAEATLDSTADDAIVITNTAKVKETDNTDDGTNETETDNTDDGTNETDRNTDDSDKKEDRSHKSHGTEENTSQTTVTTDEAPTAAASTGDNTNVNIWILLMCTATIAILGSAAGFRRKKKLQK